MLKIRLQRVGRKNHAEFRVVVSEHARAAKKAGFVEIVGSYSPHGGAVTLKEDRISHWLSKGAQPSLTVHNFLVKKGLMQAKKKPAFIVKPPKAKEAPAQEDAAPEQKETKEETPTEEPKTTEETPEAVEEKTEEETKEETKE